MPGVVRLALARMAGPCERIEIMSQLPGHTIYLTGAANTTTDILASYHDDRLPLGLLVQPLTRDYLRRQHMYTWAAIDNGLFTKSGKERFRLTSYLDMIREGIDRWGDYLLFATAPDVVGDWDATLAESMPVLPMIRAAGAPAALVLQDGATTSSVPWDACDALFIGGSTAWKIGPDARAITQEAKRRKMWVHMGRVNSESRMLVADDFGCDSADGTYILHATELARAGFAVLRVVQLDHRIRQADRVALEAALGDLRDPSPQRRARAIDDLKSRGNDICISLSNAREADDRAAYTRIKQRAVEVYATLANRDRAGVAAEVNEVGEWAAVDDVVTWLRSLARRRLASSAPWPTRSNPAPTAPQAPPQRPPGGVPEGVTLDEVYEGRDPPDEDEPVAQSMKPFDVRFVIVKIDPVADMPKLLSWTGRSMAEYMKRPGNKRAFDSYRRDARSGRWMGYLVLRSPSRDFPWPGTMMMDGYHRIAAMAREGVREAYAVDVSRPVTPQTRSNPGSGGSRQRPRSRPSAEPLFEIESRYDPSRPFDYFYDRPVPKGDVRLYAARRGRSVTWLGDKGSMYRVEAGYVSPRVDNIFDPVKLGAVEHAIRAGQRIVTVAPWATVMKIDADLVGEMQADARRGRISENGVSRPFSTGDAVLDDFLADPEAAEEREGAMSKTERARWVKGMQRKVKAAERARRGDLGRYWVRLRDGNHRAVGALLAGEPYVWVRVDPRETSLPPGALR